MVQLLATPRSYVETIQAVVQLLVPTRADWAFVDLLAPDGDSFERVAIAHARPDAAEAAQSLKRVYPLASKGGRGIEAAIRERSTQCLRGMDDQLFGTIARDEHHLSALRVIRPRSAVAVPLIAHGESFGAITLARSDRDYDEGEVRFAEQYALAAAAIIDHARLLHARQRARERLERKQAVIAALSGARTAAEVAEIACRLGAEAMEAYSGAMWLCQDDGSLELAGTWETPRSFIEQFRTLAPDSDAPAIAVVRSGQPLWIESEREYGDATPSIFARAKAADRVASFGVVPLKSGARVFGVITFAHRPPRTYDREDRDHYVVLGNHIAQALERALLFDEVQKAASRFRHAIEASPTAMIIVDRTGRITLANSQVERVFGYSAAELDGKPLQLLIPHSTRDSHPSYREGFFAKPSARPMGEGRDLRGLRKDGTEVHVEIGLTPIETPDGTLVIASVVDISERVAQRRRIELLQSVTAALSRATSAQEVVATIVEKGTECLGTAQGAVWLVSADRRTVELTHSRGYREAIQDSYGRIPLDAHAPVADAIRTGKSLWIESRAELAELYPDVSAFNLDVPRDDLAGFAVPIKTGDTCLGAMSFNWSGRHTFDAAERAFIESLAQQAAHALERARLHDAETSARERFQRLQQVTSALNKATTREAIGEVCLPAICEALHATAAVFYVLSGDVLEAVSLLGTPMLSADLIRQMPLSAPAAVAEAVRTGTPLFIDSRAAVPLSIAGRVIGALGVGFPDARTIDEAERHLILAVADQCAQALERAQLLERERAMVSDLKRAVELNEMFVAILSHDLRNPLASMAMGTTLLRSSPGLSEAQRKTIERIEKSTSRMTRMVSQLLDVTRSRLAGGIAVDRKPCDLGVIVRSVVAELEPIYPKRQFVHEGEKALAGLWDPDLLGQVVSNLVSNAAAHGSDAAPVRVSLLAAAEGAQLRVHNHGPAIPAELLSTLFDPYIRGRHKLDKDGLGLGLYITHQIVRAHGGRIDVTSTDQDGTTFVVTVPR